MKILITGATGLVGSKLTKLLLTSGHRVHFLTTSHKKKNTLGAAKGFLWNPSKQEIDPKCWEGVSVLIHLAGTSISIPWTASNKKRILNSRVDSSDLLVKSLTENGIQLDTVVCASAIGYYPSSNEINFKEEATKGEGFLAAVVTAWEAATEKLNTVASSVVKLRIGLVLAKEGGVLPTLLLPVRLGAGSAFGSGTQGQSWIHIDDLTRLFQWACTATQSNIYNAVAPNPVSQNELIRTLGKVYRRPIFLPNIPAFFMRLLLGERSALVLNSQYVSSDKVQKAGFIFQHEGLEAALRQLLDRKG